MENNNAKNYSIAALVCGILGIIGSFIPVVCYFTFVLAILGIVFGVKGRKLAQPEQKGLAFVVIVENGGYGRSVCVPIISQVLSACMEDGISG